jgi:TolB-like protein/Flp pilus assembly protein TadD
MSKERDRAPLSTQTAPPEGEADPHPSGGWDSENLEVASVQASPDKSAKPDVAGGERLAIGQILSGRYRIERELGEGGMGVVYLASDEQVAGETFAIKVLKGGLDPQALDLLREEVRKTRKLSHPNIVDVHSVNVDGDKLYVLMECLEGKSLNALLDEEFGRGMPFSHARPIIEDVGAALRYAHDHNVIHSDLKPANIFVTTSGKTKLLDFGIARVSRGPLLYKPSGPLALTPAYASCEMLKGKEADRRDDIYSLACVIYEMLSGERPFGELTALEARTAGARVPPLEALSRGQNAALSKALAFEREARTPSVEKLLQGLTEDQPPRARPGALLAGAIIVVAALGLLYFGIDKLSSSRHSVVVQRANPDVQQAPVSPKSIAVLPFVDMSEKKDQDYFSDGLTEEMIDLIGQVPDLRVPARTSSFYFKGKSQDISSIAQKLHVAHVLEGSVRKAGRRLRITAQLIRADTGYQLWSQAYDRDDTDIFAVQDDIARAVVKVLKVKLSAGTPETGARATKNTEAYYHYLRGRQLDRRGRLENFRGAVDAYSQAVALDPNYAAAYAGLAIAQASVADLTGDTAELQRAEHNVDKALALAPEDAIGYAARSYLRTVWLWDWSGAQTDIEKALSLDPRNSDVQDHYARLLADQGRLPEAIAAQKKAAEIDPLSSAGWESLGFYYMCSGDYAAAVAALDRAIDIEPKSVLALNALGVTRLLQGQGEQAREAFRKIELEGLRLAGIAMAEHTLGHVKESQQALGELAANHAQEAAYQVAQVLAWRGEKDQAFDWLERAFKQRDGGMSETRTDPTLRSLHADPRFNALLRKLKLPELSAGQVNRAARVIANSRGIAL